MTVRNMFKLTHTAVLTLAYVCLNTSQAQTTVNANQLPSGAKLVGGSASVSTT